MKSERYFCVKHFNANYKTIDTEGLREKRDDRVFENDLILQQENRKRKLSPRNFPRDSRKAQFQKLKHCSSSQQAIQMIESIKASGVSLHILAFNLALEAAAKTRDIKGCRKLLRMAHNEGLEPDLVTYGASLKVAQRSRSLEFAMEVWEKLVSSGIQQNDILLNSMVSVCAEVPRSETADEFPRERVRLAEMFFRKMSNPDVISYATILTVYGKAGLRKQSLELEEEMRSKGIKMNPVIFNSLMVGCIRAREFREALSYFEEARASGELNAIVFSSAMQAHYKLKDLAAVRALWSELCKNWEPNHICFAIFLKALANEGLIQEIDDVLASEVTDVRTAGWNGVIHEFHSKGDFAGADYFFQKAYDQGKFPIWSVTEKDTLELHGHPGAVACCAVRFVLYREKNIKSYSFIVGRQMHSRSTTSKSVGDSVRECLDSLGISYTEGSKGGVLKITAEEVERNRSRTDK